MPSNQTFMHAKLQGKWSSNLLPSHFYFKYKPYKIEGERFLLHFMYLYTIDLNNILNVPLGVKKIYSDLGFYAASINKISASFMESL